MRTAVQVGLAASLLFGCGEAPRERDGLSEAFSGSCEGICGGEAPSGCFCDAECVENGDCCPDYQDVCSIHAACDDEGDGDGGADDDGGDDGLPTDQACFLGADRGGDTCLPVVTLDPYAYPSPLNNNYREPIRYLDVEAVDLDTKIAPNWRLGEISVPYKGQYQVVQPHAVEKLQRVRDQAGALVMKSGFRSPPYNAQQPGAATRSRHMYGDAFDLVPQSTSQNNLYNICNAEGAGYVAKYTSGHVHCDWRNVSVDPLFYGNLAVAPGGELEPYFTIADLELQIDTDGETYWVEASGYDAEEGELTREWTALDEAGETLETADTLTFEPPPGTSLIRVDVGGLSEVEHAL